MRLKALKTNEINRAAEVLSKAFADYPDVSYYFPDRETRIRKYLPWMMQATLKLNQKRGSNFISEDGQAVMVLVAPSSRNLKFSDFLYSGFWKASYVFPRESFGRFRACEKACKRIRKNLMGNRPHYYLWFLGVDPQSQGLGIGKWAIEEVKRLAGEAGVPIYLETHPERNIRYYENLGFKLLSKQDTPGEDLRFNCMLWESDRAVQKV